MPSIDKLKMSEIMPNRAISSAPVAVQVPSATWRMLSSGITAKKLPKGLDAVWDSGVGLLVPLVPRRWWVLRRASTVLALEKQYTDLSDRRLRQKAADLRYLFRVGRDTVEHLNHAFAVVREVARRSDVGLQPYREQVAAALALHDGCITELATGEGKTLVATMPATIAGWKGRGCHIITVNDYLARRDHQWMAPIYRFCGLTVAHIVGQMSPDERRRAYGADITYLTNKEVAADFLRDRLILGRNTRLTTALLGKMVDSHGGLDRLVMRGLEYAIVDEADSVLIDEAVTPLIISGPAPNSQQTDAFAEAARIAARLELAKHFKVDHRYREVTLTTGGRQQVVELTKPLGGIWRGSRRSEELIVQALTARHLYLVGKHYVIQDDKIVIVDEFTGRLMPDRNWRDGLHQAVEAKENLQIQPPKDTLARVSFQRFFRGYRRLAGMTGTAWEGRSEFWQIYHRPTVRIPTHKTCIRQVLKPHVYASAQHKWDAIIKCIADVHITGRPVLVGTRSVRTSEQLSEMLTRIDLDHQVLNAVRHDEEARIIAEAGQQGSITVATNMAGRGTDIKLGRDVQEMGGLYVIASEYHESGRIDRQLFGRCARQGDPGSAVMFTSLEDELIKRYCSRMAHRVVGDVDRSFNGRRVARIAQRRAERMAMHQRKQVLRTDDWLDEFLGFAGQEA